MTIQIELSSESEASLVAEAHAHGIDPVTYAGTLLEHLLAGSTIASGKLTAGEMRTMLSEIAEGSDKLPSIPTSAFTRASFYEERP